MHGQVSLTIKWLPVLPILFTVYLLPAPFDIHQEAPATGRDQ